MVRHSGIKLRIGKALQEYSADFVSRWDELIDWRKRYKSENGFFQKILEEHAAKKVLDIACGTGFHTVTLSRAGFDVTGADGSTNMLTKAKRNAEEFGLERLRFVEAEWTSLTNAFPNEKFNAIICLGNAFTHLFDDKDRLRAVREVYKLLNDTGIAIIDQRNYDKILDKGFRSNRRYYYLGKSVTISAENVSDDVIKFRYKYGDGSVYRLTMCPIRQNYLTNLLWQVGFRGVERYGDFKADYDFYEPDFIIQVAKK